MDSGKYMKKSPGKTADKYDLQLRWSPLEKSKETVREENTPVPRRVEAYLDFLEDIGPAVRDDTRVKLYTERFTL